MRDPEFSQMIGRWEQFCRRYPPLYHYTRLESVLDLLNSNSLLARPTFNFTDTTEYVISLRLILERLKARGVEDSILSLGPVPLMRLAFGADIPDLVDRVVVLLEHDLDHVEQPNIEVYVACFTVHANSPRMLRKYGEAVIAFNALLPLVACSRPRPFYTSMISRVTYDKGEFTAAVVPMGFNLAVILNDLHAAHACLEPLGPEARRETMALWVAEALCMFAPHIKGPEYAFEGEWRLKSVLSRYAGHSLGAVRARDNRRHLGLPQEAAFTTHQPKRYWHRLDIRGKLLAANVLMNTPEATVKAEEVANWMREHGMGPLDAAQLRAQLHAIFATTTAP